jgi:hypothetical protein
MDLRRLRNCEIEMATGESGSNCLVWMGFLSKSHFGRIFVSALIATARVEQGELDFEAVFVARALVSQQFHARRQIQIHSYLALGHPSPPCLAMSSAMVGDKYHVGLTAAA